MLIVYTKCMIEDFGWIGIIISIVTFLVIYSSKNPGKIKRDISNDLENKNVQTNKAEIFTKGQIIFIILAVLLFCSPLFVGFHNHFVNPHLICKNGAISQS